MVKFQICFNLGYFWHFLAIFRIENGPEITLLVFDILFFTQMLYIIELNIKMLEIIVLKWGQMGTVLVFENLLVRYPSHFFLKMPFFNHIWSHLTGVNGFLLEPFMTCNNFCHPLCLLVRSSFHVSGDGTMTPLRLRGSNGVDLTEFFFFLFSLV